MKKLLACLERLDNTPRTKGYRKMFDEVKQAIRKHYGWDVKKVKLKISNVPVNRDGTPNKRIPPIEYAGSYVVKGRYITLADREHLELVKKHYKLKSFTLDQFIKFIMTHELSHYVYEEVATEAERDEILEAVEVESFTTVYLDSYEDPPNDEKFCEYVAMTLHNAIK